MATTNDDPVIAALRRPTGYVAPLADVDPLAYRNADPISQAARDAAVQDTTGESSRALRTGIQRFAAIPEALYGAGANLVSQGAGNSALEGAAALQRRAAEGGPRVQSTADVHNPLDALALVRNQALMSAPDVALALAGGGAGGAAVKGLAKRAGLRAAEEFAARQAAKTGAETVSSDVLNRAASKFVPAALDAAEPAVAAGRAAGTVAGQYPSVVAGSVEGAPDASGKLVGGLKGASQEDTAKILLGDLGAAGLGALPEIRLLGRLGGTAAQEAVAKNAQAILPRVAKEAAVQGGLGAATGIAQTAAQYATHKWVNDNVDLMSPAAFQSYLDSAVAGGALGAGLGGGTEAGAAIGARLGGGGRTEALDGLRSTIRDNLSKFAAAKDAAYTKAKGTIDQVLGRNKEGAPVEGTPVEGDVPEEATTPTARAVDIGTKIGEGAASIHKAATDLFDRINQHLSTDEGRAATESAVKDTFSKVTEPVQAGIQATLDSFKAAMKNAKTPGAQKDVQKAYGKIIGEHVDAETPDATVSYTDHLNRLNENDGLDDRADATLSRISDRFESGQDEALAPIDRAAQQNPAKMGSKLQDQLATIVPTDSPLWHFPEAMQPIMASAEKMFTGGELDAKDHSNIDILRRIDPDKVDEWEVAGPKYAELNKGAEHVDAANAEAAAPPAAEGPTREQLLKDGGVFTENRSSPKARELWASKDPTKNANTIGIEPTQLSGGATRQRALQIDNLISKKLAQEPGQGPLNAFKSVLGDLHLAGVKVDPDTITSGTFYSSRDGEKSNLSPRQAAAIRTELKGAGGKISTELTKAGEKVAPLKPETPQHDVTHAEAHDQVEEIKGEGDNRVPGPERVPRKAPPENQSGIADVRLEPNQYEKVITEARKAPQGAERAQAMHEAGVKIGTAELAKEQEAGTINDRRFAAETKRLNDPSSGLSRKYLRDAAAGKYDSARVRETSAEDASPDFSNAAAAKAAVRDAAKKLLKNDQPTTKETAAAIKAVQKSSLGGADLTPAEARLLKVAQHASDLVGEQHPYRQALDEARGESKTEPTAERRAAVDKADRTDIGADQKVTGKARLADIGEVGEEVRRLSKEDVETHVKETEALNTMLEKMGIHDRVIVKALPSDEIHKNGDYAPDNGEIRINRNLKGPQRVETLAHELGHHIIRSELARAMGTTMANLQHLSPDEVFGLMAKHSPELHADLVKDFEAWSEKNSDPNLSYYESYASKKPEFTAAELRAKGEKSSITQGDLLRAGKGGHVEYLHQFEEYVADQISRALTQDAKSPAQKFFKGIADKLKIAYDALFSGKGAEAAPSVEKWVQSLFDRTTNDVKGALGESVPADVARTGVEAGLHAAAETRLPPAGGGPRSPNGSQPPPSPAPKGLKAMVKFIRYRLPNSARQILDQALSRGKAVRALNEVYKDQPNALKAMRDPEHGLEARIAYAYLARERGLFQSGPKATSALRNLGDDLMSMANLAGTGTFAERIFNDIANGRIESMRAAGKEYDVKAREAAYRGKAQAIANDASAAYTKVAMPLRKVFDASIQRMRQTGVPAIRRIGAMLQRHTGEAGEDPGMLPAITHTTDRYMRAAGKVFGDLNDRELLHAMSALQRQETTHNNPKVQAAMERAKSLFGELAKYSDDAGLKFPKRDNYFFVVMDLADDAKVKAFRDLVSKPEFEQRIREVLGKGDKPSTKPHAELIDRLVRAAQGLGSEDADATSKPGGFRAQNYRLLDFIYKQGTPEDVKTFASLQTKSPADVFGRYVQPLVRDAEFTRRFGKDGVKLEQAIGEAQKQGATDDQIQQVRTAMDGAMGRTGLDGSPVLRKLLGANLADKIANPASKKGIAYTQAYQNARLLPLAVLSSLVDPMGIAVRTGGDFGTAWTGFKTGMKSLVNKQTKGELNDMLQRLGSADDFLASDILNSNFGSKDDAGGARKINDFIFHANGLAQWTKATRFMALISAHGFLQKHSAGTSPTSKRYLDELGLRPGDVQSDGKNVKVMSDVERAAATPSERARDDRVRSALLRFVDESVLRPTSQQAPNWFADPYVGLVTQYKHFAYAIYDQIAKRISHEVKNGNLKALVPAMAYVPVIIASELLRGGIQYGAAGNPNRKDWGPENYTAYALDRSGLLGPKLAFQSDAVTDSKRGNVPGTSFLGPTVQQGANAVRGRSSLESALPGEALYSHWTGSQP